MAHKCTQCGLKYRGVKTDEKVSEEKVERHNAGYSHKTRMITLDKKK